MPLGERLVLNEGRFVELVVWLLPRPVSGSTHRYKYRMALIADGVCVLRFDNEAGKGDHRHVSERQVPYVFTTLDQPVSDFWQAVNEWRPE